MNSRYGERHVLRAAGMEKSAVVDKLKGMLGMETEEDRRRKMMAGAAGGAGLGMLGGGAAGVGLGMLLGPRAARMGVRRSNVGELIADAMTGQTEQAAQRVVGGKKDKLLGKAKGFLGKHEDKLQGLGLDPEAMGAVLDRHGAEAADKVLELADPAIARVGGMGGQEAALQAAGLAARPVGGMIGAYPGMLAGGVLGAGAGAYGMG